MSLPQPPVALTDVCAVIFNNTLYTYSSSAFQSLELTTGASWETLPSGESVTGGVCVGSTPADSTQAGFFVVGGTSSNSSSYSGLQKFTYSTGNWTSIAPETAVTQDRLYHGAAYVNDTDMIVMYAGSQDGTEALSTQTFTIQASSPYGVLAYQSIAPPTIKPILLPWSSSEVVMIGGSTTNSQVMLFNPSGGGWVDSGSTLASPLSKDTSSIQAAIITADDNSKSLYTFDESVSPNNVTRVVLLDASGNPVTDSAAVKRGDSSSLTLSDWPAYNSTLAPTVTRTGYSVAQGDDGMIVLAGGGGEDILCVFNGWTNEWQNATKMLTSQKSLLQSASSSASASVASSTLAASETATASATSSSTAAAAATSSGPSTNTILGIALGSIAGLGGLLVLVYFLVLRSRKRRNYAEAAHNRRASGTSSSEKDAYAIASDSFMQRPTGAGKGTFRGGHQAQDSQGSFSSVAILMGRVNQQKPSTTIMRNNSKDTKRSSSSSVFNKGLKGTISKPIPQTSQVNLVGATAIPQQARFERADGNAYGRSVAQPRPQNNQGQRPGSTRRSSGWNRYWSGGSALNILGFGNQSQGNVSTNTGVTGVTATTTNNNNLSASNVNQNGGPSTRATVVSDVSSMYSSPADSHRITQDSATVPPLDIPSMPDSKPRFQRVNSGSPTVSTYDKYIKDGMQGKIERQPSRESSNSAYSSGIPASVQECWDPTSNKPWGTDRAPSSAYSSAGYSSTNVYSTSLAPATAPGGGKKQQQYVPTGMSRQPQLAMANTSSDMSWLNLGDISRV